MNFQVELKSFTVDAKLVHKARMKHVYLRVSDDGVLQISANKHFSLDNAKELILNKENWIKKAILKKSRNLENNQIFYFGEIINLSQEFKIEFYKEKAKEHLPKIVDKYSKIMSLYPTSLKFRNNRTRLGSCSYKNGINLNINLMKYPIEVIEYVIIHELSHIKHKNHSKRFWDLVEVYCPNYKDCEKIIKSF